MRRREFVTSSLAAAFGGVPTLDAWAQTFPSRPLHVIVPSSAGGVHDIIARIWADRMKNALGSVIVEDRGGGGSSIALNLVAQAPADGYMLLLGSTSTLVLREGSSNKAYDAIKDIVSATIFAATSTSIAVNPSLPVKSVEELIDYAKANPGKLTYGSGGIGAITHVTVEMFKQRANVDMLHVPYKGMAPAMNDLLSGNISVVFPNITAQIIELHKSGKLRILAINAHERLEPIPDIPTAIEAGLPDFISQTFFGLFAPAATPRATLEKISDATQKEWADKAFQKKLLDSGFEPLLGLGPEKADAYLKAEFARWSPVVQRLGTQNQ